MAKRTASRPRRKPIKVEVGLQVEWSRCDAEVISVSEEVTNYDGKVVATNGVRLRYENHGRVVEQTFKRDYFLRALKPLGFSRERARRSDRLSEQADDVLRAVGEHPGYGTREVFVAKMDKGQPCVQLLLTEEGMDALHRLVTGRDDDADLKDALGLA